MQIRLIKKKDLFFPYFKRKLRIKEWHQWQCEKLTEHTPHTLNTIVQILK